MRTADFDYQLPQELIAQHPLPDRGASRLLAVDRSTGALEDRVFTDFPSLLAPGDLLVLNTSRVRHARLLGTRPSGAAAEVLLIHPEPDGTWRAIGKPGSALRPGKQVLLDPGLAIETVAVEANGDRRVRAVGADMAELIERFGRLPLPPYIAREPGAEDETRYQTVYAEREGSVAAPTAGLHFTPEILAAVTARGARLARIELEVGPGTFKPVEREDIAAHAMHPERYEISREAADLVQATRASGGAVWAVGTTVVRALESAWSGHGLAPGAGETSLMITPGYRFQVVDRLLTNFHLPRSTLLMLVAAFAGLPLVRRAYQHAIHSGYRFYSYGDAMALTGVSP